MKKAIVIGASSGIGRELAKILAVNGYVVGVMARRVNLLNSIRNEIKGKILVQKIDATDTEKAMETLKNFIQEMNGVDLIVISAGTGDVNDNLEWSIEHDTIRTNVTGFAALANVAIQHFIEKGAGHLVGISSIASLRGGKESPAYNASKAFESNYMEGLRQKITGLRLPINVTDIKPGFVKTAMAKGEGIFWAAPAEKAAMQIYHAIKRKKAHAYITHRWRFIAWLLKVIPDRIYERL
jgi:short-subunit dehydrogenase